MLTCLYHSLSESRNPRVVFRIDIGCLSLCDFKSTFQEMSKTIKLIVFQPQRKLVVVRIVSRVITTPELLLWEQTCRKPVSNKIAIP